MADALAQVTDVVVNRYPNRAAGTRAIDVTDPEPRSTILETFGRCADGRMFLVYRPCRWSLAVQSLLMIGGCGRGESVPPQRVFGQPARPSGRASEEIVENLYLLHALPAADRRRNRSHWVAELKQASNSRETAEDLFWALLSSREFAVQSLSPARCVLSYLISLVCLGGSLDHASVLESRSVPWPEPTRADCERGLSGSRGLHSVTCSGSAPSPRSRPRRRGGGPTTAF